MLSAAINNISLAEILIQTTSIIMFHMITGDILTRISKVGAHTFTIYSQDSYSATPRKQLARSDSVFPLVSKYINFGVNTQ
jgi:hypothetical protein